MKLEQKNRVIKKLEREKLLVSQELSSDHKMSLVLQKILSRPKVTRYALGIATSTKWARNNFVRWMFEDYPRALLFTPKRWKTGIFKRLGAYKDRVEP